MATADVSPAPVPVATAPTPAVIDGPKKRVIPRASAAQRRSFTTMGNTRASHTDAMALPVVLASGRVLPTKTARGTQMYVGDVLLKPGTTMTNAAKTSVSVDGTMTTYCGTAQSGDRAKEFNNGKLSAEVFGADNIVKRVYTPDELIPVMCFENRAGDEGTPAFCHALLFGPQTKQRVTNPVQKLGQPTIPAEIVHGLNGQSIMALGRMSWEEIVAHPAMRENTSGTNACIIIDSADPEMPSNRLLRSIDCRDMYETTDPDEPDKKIQKCIWEMFAIILDCNEAGEVEREALRFVAWDSDIHATFNLKDVSVWQTLRRVMMANDGLELAIASDLNFKEPSMNAVSIFIDVDQGSTDEMSNIPSRDEGQNRRVNGIAIKWAPLLKSFFPTTEPVALALLGEDADVEVLRGCFPAQTSLNAVMNLQKDYRRSTASAGNINTRAMQLANLGDDRLLYGTCVGAELQALINVHPAAEFEREFFVMPACTDFKTTNAELKPMLVELGGETSAKGEVVINCDALYKSGLTGAASALIDFRPMEQLPVYVLCTFKARAHTAEAKRAEPEVATSAGASANTSEEAPPALKRAKSSKRPTE